MKTRIVKLLLCTTLLSFPQKILEADSFKGSVSSSAYIFSRQSVHIEEDQLLHVRMHETFRFVYRPHSLKNLKINTSGVFYFDPVNSAVKGEPAFNLFTLNADYRNLFNRINLNFGRIFVYDASNSGRIDGLNIKGKLPWKIKYSVYGGGFVFSDGGFSNPVESHLVGMNLSIPIQSKTEFGLAISQKAHNRKAYQPKYKTSYRPKTIEVPDVAERRLGLQLNTRIRDFSVYFKTVQDLHWLNLQEVNFATSYSKNALQQISFVYYFRRPRISYNSIFSVFDAKTNREFTLSGMRALKSDWRLFSKIRMILFPDTESLVFNIGMGRKDLTAQYQYQQGYGGDFHRILLTGRNRLSPRLTLRGSLNLGNYRPLDESWEDLNTLTAGVTYRPTKLMSISADIHSLKNRYYDNDNRLLIRVSYLLP